MFNYSSCSNFVFWFNQFWFFELSVYFWGFVVLKVLAKPCNIYWVALHSLTGLIGLKGLQCYFIVAFKLLFWRCSLCKPKLKPWAIGYRGFQLFKFTILKKILVITVNPWKWPPHKWRFHSLKIAILQFPKINIIQQNLRKMFGLS